MDVAALLRDPAITALLGAVAAGAIAYIKRWFDLAHKRLELEALKVTTQIEIVSEQRKRLTGTATPTSTKLAIAKDHLARTSPTLRAIDAARIVEAVLPHTREIVREVAAKVSQMPTGPGSSGEHVILIPDNPPPNLQRPSGEHETWGQIDLPRTDAALDDEGQS